MRSLATSLAWLAACAAAMAAEDTVRLDHAVVSSEGIGKDYAEAIARTVAAARALAIEQLGFDMPETITVSARRDPKAGAGLFNDGNDRFFLTVRSERDLRRPSQSGVFTIYGLCHEVGHLAMYRLIRDHGWMTTAAAEGWAHYLGSRLVDGVHAGEGQKLWPDPYDYLADGTARLKQQVASSARGPITQGAAAWLALGEVVGDKGLKPILAAWGKAEIDPTDPGPAARKALLAIGSDQRLAQWWTKAEPLFVLKRPKSGFAAQTVPPKALKGRPTELAHDDGTPAGKRSMAGGGHAVRFKVIGDGWCLTAVRVHGSRYGAPQPPKEDFHVWLCDADFKAIADFPFPYARFARGQPGWVTLDVKPTSLPAEFIVCVGFDPTATKGVYVSCDKEGGGDSLTGLPGKEGRAFQEGDWLIRVKVDQLRSADALELGR